VNSFYEAQVIDVAVIYENTNLKHSVFATRRDPQKFPASTTAPVLGPVSRKPRETFRVREAIFNFSVSKNMKRIHAWNFLYEKTSVYT